MSDRVQQLRAIIAELESETAALDSLDDEARAALTEAVDELRDTLSRLSPDQAAPQSLVDRFRSSEERFQASHPNLAGIVLRIIDGLGQLGI